MEDKQRWAVLAGVGVAVLLSLSTWFSAVAIAPDLMGAWGLTPNEIAWLANAVQIGFVVGALASSLLAIADVFPLTRVMGISGLAAAAANAALLLEPGFAGAMVARFLTGMALAGLYPPAMKFIATWFQKGRGLAMGAVVGALTLGSASPHLVRALGADVPWQSVVVITSLGSVVSAAMFFGVLKEGPHRFAHTTIDLRQIGAVLRNRPVMLANAGYFGHMWELYAMWAWILAYAAAATTAGDWTLNPSFLGFAVIAMGAPGCVIAGVLADKFGRSTVTIGAMAISGTAALLIGVTFGTSPGLFAALALIWGLTVVADSAQFSAAVSELADSHLVGAALAFQMGVGFAITVVAIWLVPQVVEWLGGWRWSFLILVPGPILGCLAMAALKRRTGI